MPYEFGAQFFAHIYLGMVYGGSKGVELAELEKQLSAHYKNISDSFKRMSKVNDNFGLDAILSAIYGTLDKTTELRDKIDLLRKEIAYEWTNSRNERQSENSRWEMPLNPEKP